MHTYLLFFNRMGWEVWHCPLPYYIDWQKLYKGEGHIEPSLHGNTTLRKETRQLHLFYLDARFKSWATHFLNILPYSELIFFGCQVLSKALECGFLFFNFLSAASILFSSFTLENIRKRENQRLDRNAGN